MPGIVVYATPQDLAQASHFARKCLVEKVELRTFDDMVPHVPLQSVLVYLTHPDDNHVSSLLKSLKPSAANVVIYCAVRAGPEQGARLGRLIGEFRPNHTEIAFDAEAVVSALEMPRHGNRVSVSGDRSLRTMRNRLGLTQQEMGRALGVSLRTIQYWERQGSAGRGHHLRDLQELVSLLSGVLRESDIPAWLRSENDSLDGKRPIGFILDGKTRDIISEFRRLQAGEPI